MSNKRRILRTSVCSMALFALAATSASAFNGGVPVVGYAYVNDNTAGANTAAGFARHADGTLTPLAGSPFKIRGAGTGAGIPSQGAIQIADGYILAVDAGSNQISVLHQNFNGALVPAGPPVYFGRRRSGEHRRLGRPRLRGQRERDRAERERLRPGALGPALSAAVRDHLSPGRGRP